MCGCACAPVVGSIPFVDWVDPELVLSRMSSPQFASQAATLTANAREALTHPLYSVMSSPFPPPGADPHLYYRSAQQPRILSQARSQQLIGPLRLHP